MTKLCSNFHCQKLISLIDSAIQSTCPHPRPCAVVRAVDEKLQVARENASEEKTTRGWLPNSCSHHVPPDAMLSICYTFRLRLRFQVSGFRVQGSGFRVQGAGSSSVPPPTPWRLSLLQEYPTDVRILLHYSQI